MNKLRKIFILLFGIMASVQVMAQRRRRVSWLSSVSAGCRL